MSPTLVVHEPAVGDKLNRNCCGEETRGIEVKRAKLRVWLLFKIIQRKISGDRGFNSL
jgi:hypothetical protein